MVKNLISALLEHADLLEQGTSLPRLVERQGTCFPGAASVLHERIHTAMPPKQTSDPTTLLMFLSQQKKIIAALWSFLSQSKGRRSRHDMHTDCAQERSISATSSNRDADQRSTQLCLSASGIWGLDSPCRNFSSWEMTPFCCFFRPLYPKARQLVVFATTLLVARAATRAQMHFHPLRSGVFVIFGFLPAQSHTWACCPGRIMCHRRQYLFFNPFLDQVDCDLTW